ncbi:glycoside hydrolase family 55 protein [Halovivax cerinus]|uniref:Glycoside hydrolase family 55 protein n=1 Tax=Halovivax cerinus TaxID=1487865 RepID=A0ABD5NP54_9EURY|nr:glycoside hydrolase family 55 protein [Halovivax cerinus]
MPPSSHRRALLAAAASGTTLLAGCSSLNPFADESTDVRSIDDITEDDGRTAWNVAAFGIEGDGETEVGQDVHDLLARVAEVGGGVVRFPPGRYLFERTPLIGDDTAIVGAGRATVFEGPRTDDEVGNALLSNRGYDEPGYGGASNWRVANVRLDSPRSNGIVPAHADGVRLENVHGDRIYHHHVDVVSSTGVTIDGFRATRGGESDSDAPVQFDTQPEGTAWNGVLDGEATSLVADNDTPTTRCRLRYFEIDAANEPDHGVHLHRGPFESIAISDGSVSGCEYTAIRADPDEPISDLRIANVSCIDNARGITLGHVEDGRRGLAIDAVTIRTDAKDVAGGSGLYVAGFDGATITNLRVEGPFQNSIIVDDTDALTMTSITASGADDQAVRFRENVDATLTAATAADCDVGIFSGPGSTVTYGGVTVENVGTQVADGPGDVRPWTAS